MASRTIVVILGTAALLIIVASGFTPLFVVTPPAASAVPAKSVSLYDFYAINPLSQPQLIFNYSYATSSGALVVLLLAASASFSVTDYFTTLISREILVLLWPIMIIAGLVFVLRRRLGLVAGALGIAAFLSALIFLTRLAASVAATAASGYVPAGSVLSLGIGAYLEIVATAIFFVAWALARRGGAGLTSGPMPAPTGQAIASGP